MHARRTGYLQNSLATLAVAAFVLCLPLFVPYAIFAASSYKRRLRKAAEALHCVNCGSLVGKLGVNLAAEKSSAEMAELRRTHPGVKFRIGQTLHAICPQCQTPFTFHESDGTFTVQRQSGVRA
jgi:hypothetical protein